MYKVIKYTSNLCKFLKFIFILISADGWMIFNNNMLSDSLASMHDTSIIDLPSTYSMALVVSSPTMHVYSASSSRSTSCMMRHCIRPSVIISNRPPGSMSSPSLSHNAGTSAFVIWHWNETISPSRMSTSVRGMENTGGNSGK